MTSDDKWLATLSQADMAELILKVVWIQKAMTFQVKS
jgi:hypothetical protein